MSSRRQGNGKEPIMNRPTILVLEGLSGAAEAVRTAGGNTLTMSPRDVKGVEDAFLEDAVDGLLLTGGGDVDPRRYRQQPHKMTYGVNENRDRVEFRAVQLARRYRLPVMGICRGCQVMNVEAGGTLHQHLPDRLKNGARHRHGELPVRFATHSLVAEAVGQRQATVTHLHHQAVQYTGRGYRPSGWHPDGTIEVIESTDGIWRVGVQFHPEMSWATDPERGLFRQLVTHAAILSGMEVPPVRPTRRKKKAASSASQWSQTSAGIYRKGPDEADVTVIGPRPQPRALPASSSDAYPITTNWLCFRCNRMRFDRRDDYVDHMWIIHDVLLNRETLVAIDRPGVTGPQVL